MVNQQYFHLLIIEGVTPGTTQKDDRGRFIVEPEPASYEQECRYEPTSKPRQIKTTDGNFIYTQGTVFMPLSAQNIKVGTLVQIAGDVLHKTKVLEFRRGLLNCKITV